jgi:hypothetical protein
MQLLAICLPAREALLAGGMAVRRAANDDGHGRATPDPCRHQDFAMPFLSFAEWRPDVSDYRAASSQLINNVLPRGDGYGPFPDFVSFTAALAAACRGYCFAPHLASFFLFWGAMSSATHRVQHCGRRCRRLSVVRTFSQPADRGGFAPIVPQRHHRR